LLQKFESFLKRLQNRINKGLDCELVVSKIKEVEVKREEKVEIVIPISEIKEELEIMILTFVIKLEQAKKDEVKQER
jgi:gluconate kinase